MIITIDDIKNTVTIDGITYHAIRDVNEDDCCSKCALYDIATRNAVINSGICNMCLESDADLYIGPNHIVMSKAQIAKKLGTDENLLIIT